MQIYNSISFGAILNGKGQETRREAKILAKYKDYLKHSTEYSDTFKKSSEIIDTYCPNSKLNISIDNSSTHPYYKVEENGEYFYGHTGGDAYEFLIGLAKHIAHEETSK